MIREECAEQTQFPNETSTVYSFYTEMANTETSECRIDTSMAYDEMSAPAASVKDV